LAGAGKRWLLPRWRHADAALSALELDLVGAGNHHGFPLGQGWNQRSSTADVVREFRWAKVGHLHGLNSSATVSDHVGYESWLERDRLILLDREPEVIGMASQPDDTADRIGPRV
jgi:hypothetical protein